MTSKRVTFDLMNLGFPVHTDPLEVERPSSQESFRGTFNPDVLLSDKLLRQRLDEEVKNIGSDFFLTDPSSSDDSDDSAFPETIYEQVRRLSFAKQRRLHYTEFATVELARRLVCEEFALETSSVKSEDIAFQPEEIGEECSPCWMNSLESFPYLQYERNTTLSPGSSESALREDPEPGFDPSHPCYRKLVGQLGSATTGTTTPGASKLLSKVSLADINTDLHESMERHTRVLDKGEKWDLQQSHPHQLTLSQQSSKSSRLHTNTLYDKSGKSSGNRSM
ncbi:hypothetical protein KR059_009077 [Drosophila kikkawai]|nr:hypothetical protein KR059_009077 [Drosophila kikkawai]